MSSVLLFKDCCQRERIAEMIRKNLSEVEDLVELLI